MQDIQHHLVQGPDEVPGVVLPIPGDHAAGGDHSVAHPLQPVEDLYNKLAWSMPLILWSLI